MKNIFPLLILLTLISCSSLINFDKKVNNLVVVEVKLSNRNKVLDTMTFMIYRNTDSIKYEYKSQRKKSLYLRELIIKKSKLNDSILIVNNENCNLIDAIDFQYKNDKIKIYKYLYDLPRTIDEETEYFFTKEYGLILSRSVGWFNEYLYNNEYLNEIQDSIILNKKKFKPSFTLITKTEE